MSENVTKEIKNKVRITALIGELEKTLLDEEAKALGVTTSDLVNRSVRTLLRHRQKVKARHPGEVPELHHVGLDVERIPVLEAEVERLKEVISRVQEHKRKLKEENRELLYKVVAEREEHRLYIQKVNQELATEKQRIIAESGKVYLRGEEWRENIKKSQQARRERERAEKSK